MRRGLCQQLASYSLQYKYMPLDGHIQDKIAVRDSFKIIADQSIALRIRFSKPSIHQTPSAISDTVVHVVRTLLELCDHILHITGMRARPVRAPKCSSPPRELSYLRQYVGSRDVPDQQR